MIGKDYCESVMIKIMFLIISTVNERLREMKMIYIYFEIMENIFWLNTTAKSQ